MIEPFDSTNPPALADVSDFAPLEDSVVIQPRWEWLLTNNQTGETYRVSHARLLKEVSAATTGKNGKPVPAPPTFENFTDNQAGGSVQLVPAAGVALTDYRYKVGADGNYQPVPADGVLVVGNVGGKVYAYSQETATHQVGPVTATEQVFTSFSSPVSPLSTPAAPRLVNFDDATNSIIVVANAGIPMSDYRYILGPGANEQLVPETGIVNVGAFSGFLYAYSVPAPGRNRSLIAVSPEFNATTAPPAGTTPTPTPESAIAYYGVGPTTTPTAAQVAALTSQNWAAQARTITFNCDGTHPYLWERASYGVRTLIRDKNDLNVTPDIIRTNLTINGVAGNLYVHANEQYDPEFILEYSPPA